MGKVVNNDKMANIRETMDKLFHQFGKIADAIPVGAEAEALKFRMVTDDYDITEPLVLVNLFVRNIIGENISQNLLTVFTDL